MHEDRGNYGRNRFLRNQTRPADAPTNRHQDGARHQQAGGNTGDTQQRVLARIEAKMTRGFESLGVSVEKDADWMSVDEAKREVRMTTMSHSLKVVLAEMGRRGAKQRGAEYEMIYQDGTVGWIIFDDSGIL